MKHVVDVKLRDELSNKAPTGNMMSAQRKFNLLAILLTIP